uniref:Uncharacterized protein n=2 Tax=viral metagenome TaxID=1070528 RepID=A0A6M3M0A1_9ZZZZ
MSEGLRKSWESRKETNMPSAEPLKIYQEAINLHQKGNRQQAAQMLAEAMGTEKPSRVLLDSIDLLLEHNSTPNDIVLRIVATETAPKD